MPDELITLPNGQRVLYNDAQHRYYVPRETDGKRGGQLHGLSSVGKSFELDSDGLMSWAADLGIDGVVQLYGGQELPFKANEVKQRVYHEKRTWRDVRSQAGTRGTNVHEKALEALAMGSSIEYEGLSHAEIGYAEAVEDWWFDKKPEVLQCEHVVAGLPDYMFAGRFDLRCVIDGAVCVVDLKTSKSVGTSHYVQIAGYDFGCELSGLGSNDRQIILHVRPDGTYEEYDDALCSRDDFLVALENYQRALPIERITEARRKKANEAKKRARAEAAGKKAA